MPRRHYSDRTPLNSRSIRRKDGRVRSDFDRDLAAMKRVWQMIRQGAVRMVGEVGRQY
ncbi:MAG: hypothetical protein VXZ59_00145 [Cyanobacteriota bacterium]|nr:hypothetical protein [Cyanobacteriota bacterium]